MDATAIYDEHGAVVGWLRDDVIYERAGRPLAFLHTSRPDGTRPIITYGGRCAGEFDRGWLRDPGGQAFGFLKDATGSGPANPARLVRGAPPTAPAFAAPPARPAIPALPKRVAPGKAWAKPLWERFFF